MEHIPSAMPTRHEVELTSENVFKIANLLHMMLAGRTCYLKVNLGKFREARLPKEGPEIILGQYLGPTIKLDFKNQYFKPFKLSVGYVEPTFVLDRHQIEFQFRQYEGKGPFTHYTCLLPEQGTTESYADVLRGVQILDPVNDLAWPDKYPGIVELKSDDFQHL